MWVALAVLLMAIMLGAAGQICLKFGLGKLGSQAPFIVVTAMFRDWYVLAGFVAYGISSLMYLFVLSTGCKLCLPLCCDKLRLRHLPGVAYPEGNSAHIATGRPGYKLYGSFGAIRQLQSSPA